MRGIARTRARNNFGALVKAYDSVRKGYPPQVYFLLKRALGSQKEMRVLDIGCGTGISTRELKRHGFRVVGADKDRKMIAAARKKEGVRYVVAQASKLPFPKENFDAVVAFTAFHWFTDRKSLTEIKRVLKPHGLFFVVTKNPSDNKRFSKVRQAYGELRRKYAGKDTSSTRGYRPEKVVRANGFSSIKKASYYFEEKYSISGAVHLIRSYSFWHLVPDRFKSAFAAELRDMYKKHFPSGVVIRDRDADIVYGRKK